MSVPADDRSLSVEDGALPEYAKRLRDELQAAFGGTVEAESTGTGQRCRFAVVSPKFEDMDDFDRQDAVWDVADNVLDRRDVVQITLILTYAPSEIDSPVAP